jgi:hypothetical protein
MRFLILRSFALGSVLGCLIVATAEAQDGAPTTTSGQNTQTGLLVDERPDLTANLLDPVVQLRNIRQRREIVRERGDSLFLTSPLTPLRDRINAAEERLYDLTDFNFGISGNHLLQGITDNIPGTDDYGMSSFYILTGTWDGWKKGCPNQGEITFSIEGRWNYGPPDPVALGAAGLGTTLFTANPFTTYTPTFLVRNLFWRQGSREAGWRYRIGKVTPDQFFASSRHVTPLDTFLPIGTGAFCIALPDSGPGAIGGFYINDRVNVAFGLHDANANRFNFGAPGKGDWFKAVELQAKILPRTENAGYSKVTFWHTDGTANGQPVNGSLGPEGWGVYLKLEQELTEDGRLIAVGRWGRSYNGSALYQKLVGAHLIYYDPFNSGRYERLGFTADVVGLASTWGLQNGAIRDETDVEVFYRFPLLPEMDATVAYQAIFNPGLNPNSDFGSAISLRLRSTW